MTSFFFFSSEVQRAYVLQLIKVLGFTTLGDFDSEFFIVNRCVLYITPPPPTVDIWNLKTGRLKQTNAGAKNLKSTVLSIILIPVAKQVERT